MDLSVLNGIAEWHAQLVATIRAGDEVGCTSVLSKGSVENVQYAAGADNSLNYASYCGYARICALLLGSGWKPVLQTCELEARLAVARTRPGEHYSVVPGRNALHYAAMAGHEQVCTLLLRSNAQNTLDANSMSPFYYAVAGGHVDVVQAFLSAREPAALHVQRSGLALHHAARGNHLEVYRLLHEHPAFDYRLDAQGRTPLKVALESRSLDVCAYISVATGHREACQSDEKGRTPLHAAAMHCRPDLCRALVQTHCSILFDGEGRTALHYAARRGDMAVLAELYQHRAVRAYVDAADLKGQTALHVACEGGESAAARCLVESGARAYARDSSGRTPLHYAAAKCAADVVTLIGGADPRVVNARDDLGSTALHEAAKCGRAHACAALLALGAHIDARDARANTALYYAASSGGPAPALLVQRGADVSARCAGGNTALHAACRVVEVGERAALVRLLLASGAPQSYNDACEPPLLFACFDPCVVGMLSVAGAACVPAPPALTKDRVVSAWRACTMAYAPAQSARACCSFMRSVVRSSAHLRGSEGEIVDAVSSGWARDLNYVALEWLLADCGPALYGRALSAASAHVSLCTMVPGSVTAEMLVVRLRMMQRTAGGRCTLDDVRKWVLAFIRIQTRCGTLRALRAHCVQSQRARVTELIGLLSDCRPGPCDAKDCERVCAAEALAKGRNVRRLLRGETGDRYPLRARSTVLGMLFSLPVHWVLQGCT